jgi:hypothetical protein
LCPPCPCAHILRCTDVGRDPCSGFICASVREGGRPGSWCPCRFCTKTHTLLERPPRVAQSASSAAKEARRLIGTRELQDARECRVPQDAQAARHRGGAAQGARNIWGVCPGGGLAGLAEHDAAADRKPQVTAQWRCRARSECICRGS